MKTMTVSQLEVRDPIPHDDVDALVRAALSSEDAREGMLARLEKRSARFQGKYDAQPTEDRPATTAGSSPAMTKGGSGFAREQT
jgi:hypothetical protein